MKARAIRSAGSALAIVIVAAIWVVSYELNLILFSGLAHSRWAHWIFLPAAIRLLAVLLLGWRGVAGLVLGAFWTLRPEDAAQLSHAIWLPLSSGVAPWLSVRLWAALAGLREDLAGLRPSDIVALGIGCAAANSALLNLFLTASGDSRQDVIQILTIMIGDALGIILVTGSLAQILSLRATGKLPRRPG